MNRMLSMLLAPIRLQSLLLATVFAVNVHAADAPPAAAPETPAQEQPAPEAPLADDPLADLGRWILAVDDGAERSGNRWLIRYGDMPVMVVADAGADRMRIMAPIAAADDLAQEHLYRLMQANFESALDARYAIAQGTLWSAFIHPLSPLIEAQFYSAMAQTITLVVTYGSSFSSGALLYGEGDNADADAEARRTYEGFLRRSREI